MYRRFSFPGIVYSVYIDLIVKEGQYYILSTAHYIVFETFYFFAVVFVSPFNLKQTHND